MMKKIEYAKIIIWKASLLLLTGLLLFVLYFSLSDWNSALFFMENYTGIQRIATSILGMWVLFFFFLALKKMIRKADERKIVKAAYILMGVFTLLQLFYLFTMKVGLRYDALKIVDEAVSVLKTGAVSDTHLEGYFARYTNNYAILFLTIVLFKLFRFLGILGEQYENAVFLLGMVNIFMINMGIFFLWKLAGKLKGEKVAFLCLLWALCNPIFLIWTPFYYTNTVSMGLLMAVYYGFYLLAEQDKMDRGKWKTGFLALGCGALLWTACNIRATVFITVIAALGYLLLQERKKTADVHDGKSEKNNRWHIMAVKLICMLFGIVLAAGGQKAMEEKYVNFDTTDTGFPAVHWIAMGAGGQGVYNIVDEYYTMGFETKEEKVQGDMELLKERLKNLGVSGYGSLMFDKLRLTFSDGSGGYLSELGVSQRYLPAHKYFLGGKSDFLGAYGAVYYSFCLLLFLIGTLLSIVRKKTDFFYVVRLNLLGAFLFHMLWEAGTIYSIGFMTLLPLGMIDGFGLCEKKVEKITKGKIKFAACIPILCLFLLFLYKSNDFFVKDYTTNEATVNQFLYQCDEEELLLEGRLYVQSFIGDKEFNRLGIQVKNQLGEDNSAVYHITLLDSGKKVLTEERVDAAGIAGYDFITLSFQKIDGRKNHGNYYVVIEKVQGSSKEGLTFLSYNTGNYDAYTRGTVEIYEGITLKTFMNEEMNKNITGKKNLRDLAFCVYYEKNAPYF